MNKLFIIAVLFLSYSLCSMNNDKSLIITSESPNGLYKSRDSTQFKPITNVKYVLNLKNIQETGKGIRVGIVEKGLDKDHEDIKNNLSISIRDNDNILVSEHGTSVIHMVTQVAPEVIISHLEPKIKRVAEKYSTFMEKLKIEKEYHLIDALEKAKTKKDLRIVNISRDIGGNCPCPLYVCYKCELTEQVLSKIKELTDAKIIVVKSIGNEGGKGHEKTQYYESMMKFATNTNKKMLLVGSIEYKDSGKEILSPYSVKAISYEDPVIFALGTNVLVATKHNSHDSNSGTSFAAPMVSGALALLMEAFPVWKDTPEKYVELLLKTAKKTNSFGEKLGPEFGAGILDIEAALKEGKERQYQKSEKNNEIVESDPSNYSVITKIQRNDQNIYLTIRRKGLNDDKDIIEQEIIKKLHPEYWYFDEYLTLLEKLKKNLEISYERKKFLENKFSCFGYILDVLSNEERLEIEKKEKEYYLDCYEKAIGDLKQADKFLETFQKWNNVNTTVESDKKILKLSINMEETEKEKLTLRLNKIRKILKKNFNINIY